MAQTRIQSQQEAERLKHEKNALERKIREHYERLNAIDGNAAKTSELQFEIRDNEQRLNEVLDELATVSSLILSESDVREALGDFDEVWNALSPAERAKTMNQVVDCVAYNGHESNLSITYHPLGIKMFANEHNTKVEVLA